MRRDERERRRQTHLEGRALAAPAPHAQLAARLLDHPLDHVESDAAPRDGRQLARRREAGAEDEPQRLLFADARVRGEQAALDGRARHALGIDAAPVVGHAQGDAAPFGRRLQRHAPALGLARGAALRRRLDAVIHGVAQRGAGAGRPPRPRATCRAAPRRPRSRTRPPCPPRARPTARRAPHAQASPARAPSATRSIFLQARRSGGGCAARVSQAPCAPRAAGSRRRRAPGRTRRPCP